MSDIVNPHDKFFKETFSRLEIARDFLQHYLPPNVSRLLNLDTLALEKDSYTDTTLQERFSDLLFSVETTHGQPIRIFILFEHKSYSEPLIAFYLLRYMVRIWEGEVKNGSLWLTPIFPLVVYHGEEEWRISERFSDLLPQVEELRPYLPDFQYFLFDLSRYPDHSFVGKVPMQSVLRLLKHIFDPALEEQLEVILNPVMAQKEKMNVRDFLETMIIYLVNGANRLQNKKVEQDLEKILKKGGFNIMPTLAQQWLEEGRKEGRKEGREEGREEGLRESIYNTLSERFDRVPMELINTIQSVSGIDSLNNLQRQAVRVSSVDDFIKILSQHRPQD